MSKCTLLALMHDSASDNFFIRDRHFDLEASWVFLLCIPNDRIGHRKCIDGMEGCASENCKRDIFTFLQLELIAIFMEIVRKLPLKSDVTDKKNQSKDILSHRMVKGICQWDNKIRFRSRLLLEECNLQITYQYRSSLMSFCHYLQRIDTELFCCLFDKEYIVLERYLCFIDICKVC